MRLEARELVLTLGRRRLLDAVSLAVDAGEVAAIEGASGSGKSTLLRALAALVEVDSGEVFLDGVPSHAITPPELRRRVAYVPQQAPMLEGSVADNVATGPRLRGETPSSASIVALLEHVGLSRDLAEQPARELSGGERQRVALARALANRPEVLLLDEPIAALDASSAATVLDRVQTLAREGLAIVLVSHQPAIGRKYTLIEGRIEGVAP